MALVKCPECGRENVSNTAESCPSCGYGIKAHFEREEKKRAEEIIRKQQQSRIDSRSAEKEQKYREYEHEIRARQQEIDAITEPKKPNFFLGLFEKQVRTLSFFILIGPWITLLFCKLAGVDNMLLLLYIVLGWLATPIWLFICYGDYKSDVARYKEELNLYNRNRKEWEKQKERQKANIAEMYRYRADNEVEQKYAPPAPKPTSQLKCPVCGSDNIERITTIDRGVSVAMVGLASGKIGKQYKCKKCKHMW